MSEEKEVTTIEKLKKNDAFIFNDIEWRVTRKYIDDDRPLIAFSEEYIQTQRFYHEGLEVVRVN
jgi:hypothetical protein